MNSTKIFLALVLAAFAAVNVYGVTAEGLGGFFALIENARGWTLVLLCDLVIALALTIAWMFGDAKTKGVSALPYVFLTATTGSIGTLLYLIRRRA